MFSLKIRRRSNGASTVTKDGVIVGNIGSGKDNVPTSGSIDLPDETTSTDGKETSNTISGSFETYQELNEDTVAEESSSALFSLLSQEKDIQTNTGNAQQSPNEWFSEKMKDDINEMLRSNSKTAKKRLTVIGTFDSFMKEVDVEILIQDAPTGQTIREMVKQYLSNKMNRSNATRSGNLWQNIIGLLDNHESIRNGGIDILVFDNDESGNAKVVGVISVKRSPITPNDSSLDGDLKKIKEAITKNKYDEENIKRTLIAIRSSKSFDETKTIDEIEYRCISGDKYFEEITGDPEAYKKLRRHVNNFNKKNRLNYNPYIRVIIDRLNEKIENGKLEEVFDYLEENS